MKKAGIALLIFLSCATLQAQELDSLLKNDIILAEFDSLLNSEDSLSLFQMIDNLLSAPAAALEKSQLAIRLGYNSNAVAASRTLGISQFGLAPGVSYYHPSGLYADITGYWSSEYDPKYYLTVASGGYMKTVGKHWTFLAEYSHYFYSDQSDDVSVPYTNNMGISNFFEFGPLNIRADYSLYFGEKTAHRITPGLFLNFEKRNWHGLKRIALFPSFNVLLGVEEVTTYVPEIRQYSTRPLVIRYLENHGISNNYTYYAEKTQKQFGVMNYSLSAPVSVALKNWTFLLSYTYNFPRALKGEQLSIGDGGYLSVSITRYFQFKK